MGSFRLTNQAKADLKSIAVYTQRKWGQAQRRINLKQLDDAFHLLAGTPNLGIDCNSIKAGYRKFPVSSHLIFYRNISSSEIEFVRVLHKRMDVKLILQSP